MRSNNPPDTEGEAPFAFPIMPTSTALCKGLFALFHAAEKQNAAHKKRPRQIWRGQDLQGALRDEALFHAVACPGMDQGMRSLDIIALPGRKTASTLRAVERAARPARFE
ncbi:hypothetical protein [Azospirillum rugosum]|uniref:Uncharacterized protein n=1 Tax=Azospirillum rugosum TaxID=416170 RepID=A0ABS4SFA4_9PROT|nr:hypothetical protein [Azospirillum rugosum]MBP2291256.1 hypothetical protein [Azospirillum rugosum]MDQ0524680.1 hypothetical protein [Azospirillum rugosum]